MTTRGTNSAGESLVIATAATDSYVMPLAVMLYTALLHHRGSRRVEIIVIDGGITQDNKSRIERVLSPFQFTLSWVEPPTGKLHGLKVLKKYPVATYYRLFAADLLPANYQKLLFIDADCIVEADLEKLWEVDLEGCVLLAAQDQVNPVLELGLLNYRELGLPPRDMYFNSGVLLIDLDQWRREEIGEKAAEYVRKNPEQIRFVDQDGLNAVLQGRWKLLDRRWNLFPCSIDQAPLAGVAPAHVLNRLRSQPDRPFIIHTAGDAKPWNGWLKHPVQHVYFRYLRETGLLTWSEWCFFMARMLFLRFKLQTLGPVRKRARKVFSRRGAAAPGNQETAERGAAGWEAPTKARR